MIDRRRRAPLTLAALLTLTGAGTADAQLTETSAPTTTPAGWSVTPLMGVAQLWDDNPTLAAEGDVRTGDFVTALRPSVSLDFRSSRTTLRTDYTGSFDFYRDLSEQDTRDHRAGLDLTHQVTRRVQLFARDHAIVSPTTGDVADLGATVLRRQTTRMNTFRGGMDALLRPHTTLNLTYATQWVDFAREDQGVGPLSPIGSLLQGGHSQGGAAGLRHRLSERLAVGADYEVQRATVGQGAEIFDVQSALGVTEFALTRAVDLTAAYGHAWLTAGRNGVRDSGPAFNIGLDWQGRRAAGTVTYGRSFLPSFGFGGTFQNQELRGTLRMPLSKWLQWSGSIAATDNEPLEVGNPALRAFSAQTSLGWTVKRRLRLEVYGQHVSQDSRLAGGHVLRSRAGVQATVSQTVRASR